MFVVEKEKLKTFTFLVQVVPLYYIHTCNISFARLVQHCTVSSRLVLASWLKKLVIYILKLGTLWLLLHLVAGNRLTALMMHSQGRYLAFTFDKRRICTGFKCIMREHRRVCVVRFFRVDSLDAAVECARESGVYFRVIALCLWWMG